MNPAPPQPPVLVVVDRQLTVGAWYTAGIAIGSVAGLVTLVLSVLELRDASWLAGAAVAGFTAGAFIAIATGWLCAVAIASATANRLLDYRSAVRRSRWAGTAVLLAVYGAVTYLVHSLYGEWWLLVPVPLSLALGWVSAPQLVRRASMYAVQEPTNSDPTLTVATHTDAPTTDDEGR